MDLRDQVAEAIEKHEASPTKAYLILDAVMEAVEEDAAKRRAYTERRVELARKAEAAIWKRRIREQKEEGDAIIAEEQARVRELEDENQRMRDDLDAATAFSAGGWARPFHIEILPSGDWGIYAETWHDDPIETHPDRAAALSRARQVAKEET